MAGKIVIRQYRTQISLGVPEEERAQPQPVDFSLSIRMPEEAFSGADQIDSTLCYDQICQTISTLVEGQSFSLLEKLTYEVYQGLKAGLLREHPFQLTAHKVNAPVDHLLGGVQATYGEEK